MNGNAERGWREARFVKSMDDAACHPRSECTVVGTARLRHSSPEATSLLLDRPQNATCGLEHVSASCSLDQAECAIP